METEIKGIGNYYGGLIIKEESGKYYWLIENYNTDLDDIEDWDEIPKTLYFELLNFNKS